MESPEGVAAKRRILVDALAMCLERSKVCEAVDARTVRSVLGSAAGEIWREGEFRLEVVWQILCQQPGISGAEVAPPLLAFKAFEAELGVQVRVPQALSALPRSEQTRLREQLAIGAEDFAKTIADLKALAAAPPIAPQAAPRTVSKEPMPKKRTAPRPAAGTRRGLAIGLCLVAVIALGGAIWMSVSDSSTSFDTSDVGTLLKLTQARHQGRSLIARIDDPRWNGLGRDDQKKIVDQLFTIESQKGIRVLTLTDGSRTRVVASDLTGSRSVLIK